MFVIIQSMQGLPVKMNADPLEEISYHFDHHSIHYAPFMSEYIRMKHPGLEVVIKEIFCREHKRVEIVSGIDFTNSEDALAFRLKWGF